MSPLLLVISSAHMLFNLPALLCVCSHTHQGHYEVCHGGSLLLQLLQESVSASQETGDGSSSRVCLRSHVYCRVCAAWPSSCHRLDSRHCCHWRMGKGWMNWVV